MNIRHPEHGRFLEDFAIGETYPHPWEVSLDDGMIALFSASFLDATPTFASAVAARRLGLRARPAPPLMLLALALSMSVQDVSERAIAHLGYHHVRFPSAAYPGDTVTATSTVVAARAAKSGDRGVVRVRTLLSAEDGRVLCAFERSALIAARGGALRPAGPLASTEPVPRLPPELSSGLDPISRRQRFLGFARDFSPGDVIVHSAGRTVTEAEHVALSWLLRNTHPLHTDERYCQRGGSFMGTRVVYGGLVLAWAASLASRDICGNAIWDLGWDEGAHPAPVVAGDTLYSASLITAVAGHDRATSRVAMRLVGVKNKTPQQLIAALPGGAPELFAPERDKPAAARIAEKVVEIDRSVLMWTAPA